MCLWKNTEGQKRLFRSNGACNDSRSQSFKSDQWDCKSLEKTLAATFSFQGLEGLFESLSVPTERTQMSIGHLVTMIPLSSPSICFRVLVYLLHSCRRKDLFHMLALGNGAILQLLGTGNRGAVGHDTGRLPP